jgi:hypothetical protein
VYGLDISDAASEAGQFSELVVFRPAEDKAVTAAVSGILKPAIAPEPDSPPSATEAVAPDFRTGFHLR